MQIYKYELQVIFQQKFSCGNESEEGRTGGYPLNVLKTSDLLFLKQHNQLHAF